MKRLIVAAALLAGHAFAASIPPAFDTFGTLAGATFGGSGIPNDAVAITDIREATGGPLLVTLGLTAHQRYSNPALSNDGAGTFSANPGVDTNAPSPADPYALWNFAFYLGGSGLNRYNYVLFYDFDPAANTEAADHGQITVPGGNLVSPIENSLNLGMNFLDVATAGLIPPPNFGAFDPTVSGQYSFALVAYSGQQEVGRSAIRVDVGQVPEPATLALLGLGLAGLGFSRRKQ